MANGFGADIEGLNFHNKLQRFDNLTMLNERIKTNALHISLNFDSSENLQDDKLQEIATAYMDKIGFGDQPYLVYRHLDAAHHHVHIATTNMQANGKRIDIHNIRWLVKPPHESGHGHKFGSILSRFIEK